MSTVQRSVVVTVKPKMKDHFRPDEIISLKFASVVLDSNEEEKEFIKCEAEIQQRESGMDYKYKNKINVPEDFGEIGAVIVELQEDVNERFIDSIFIEKQTPHKLVMFSCKSWVQPRGVIGHRRIFFSTKSYLPGRTPSGLVKLREEDLQNLRGKRADGSTDKNERRAFERIYDYDVYNDLGNPDASRVLKRPVLGGSNYPYPRRCRTGRPHSQNDPSSEQRSRDKFYVPRDEEFSEVKELYFNKGRDSKDTNLLGKDSFSNLSQIESMFRDGIEAPSATPNILQFDISSMVSPDQPDYYSSDVLNANNRFPIPESYRRDQYNWLSDSEFARQTLAGLNPCSIQLVKSLPFMSKLDSGRFGPPESKFTLDRVQELLGSSIEVGQAITQKRLFVLDYHDILMEYVIEVRNISEKTLYASRTLFFRRPEDDTLMPLGIELTRPKMNTNDEQWKKIFVPGTTGTDVWLWRLAKAHVLSHDSCIHQVVIHWLRAHCCMEPYAIATNRQLSTMHPIYRLLHPHFRYTMRINANARATLINAGGIIESTFSTASHSMEISSIVYKKEWRFDEQALPDDLIRRGMAERKEDAPHGGVELVIKDYPFANDGLILWDALLKWVKKYVNHYYQDNNAVINDKELQAWWQEIREKGHPDKNEGWLTLDTRANLIKIVSTIAWVGSGHHAAVNFIQYAYAGYMPNRPSIARIKMLTEDYEHLTEEFINQPEKVLLQVFPSSDQTKKVMFTMISLSAHSPDEEYIGNMIEPAWDLEPSIREAFIGFKNDLKYLETHIVESNNNSKLKNRHGAGVMPYDVMKPQSEHGITGRGVPYSVSI